MGISRIITGKDLITGSIFHMRLPESKYQELIQKSDSMDKESQKLVITRENNEYKIDILPMELSFNQLKKALKEEYPEAWFRNGYDYSPDYKDCVWTGEGSYTNDGDLLFDKNLYQDGIHPGFKEYLDSVGWHCEWVNHTTVMICIN